MINEEGRRRREREKTFPASIYRGVTRGEDEAGKHTQRNVKDGVFELGLHHKSCSLPRGQRSRVKKTPTTKKKKPSDAETGGAPHPERYWKITDLVFS